jgi:hypothetical protein
MHFMPAGPDGIHSERQFPLFITTAKARSSSVRIDFRFSDTYLVRSTTNYTLVGAIIALRKIEA